ncbi:MAG: hypothetical protein IPI79_04030 [Moraxellaceae bacterium]|nr:hypothetical protein [Moraxellaceae bacterium]
MPLSWNEIKSRAAKFSKDWQHESSEDAEAKSFGCFFTFLALIDVALKLPTNIPLKKPDAKRALLMCFGNKLIIEHKSKGKDKDLQKAYQQSQRLLLTFKRLRHSTLFTHL